MFEQAKLKANWAASMIRDIANASHDLAAQQRRKIITGYDPESGTVSLSMDSAITAVPASIVLITGTCVQTMRSCLDYITSELRNVAKGTDTRLHFPIAIDLDELKASSAFKKVEGFSPELARCILDTIKPTKAKNFGIWAINRLANTDKHRNILLAFVVDAMNVDEIKRSDGMEMKGLRFSRPAGAGQGGPILIPNVVAYSKPYPSIHVAFAEPDIVRPDVYDGLEIVETLSGFLKAVNETIAAIESVFSV